MDVENAIKTAIEYETRVKAVYAEAAEMITDQVGKKVVSALANEEQNHVNYLKSRLRQWHEQGMLTPEKLETVVPDRKAIGEGVKKLKGHMKIADRDTQLQMLWKALEVEIETSNFYKQMVSQLEAEPQRMFARFLEIEDGHQAIVKAEIDALTGMGVWFDFVEFDLEAN